MRVNERRARHFLPATSPIRSVRARAPFLGAVRLSSIALVGTLLIALGGLFAIDRALSAHEQSEADVQAVETAAMIRGFLTVHAEALQSVRLLYIAGGGVLPEAELRSLMAPMLEYANAFHRLWIAGPDFVVRESYLVAGPGGAFPEGFRVDTTTRLDIGTLSRLARASGRTQITPAGELLTEQHGFVIIEPLFAEDGFLGLAAGAITSPALLQHVLRPDDRRLHGVVIRAGENVIASEEVDPRRRAFVHSATAQIVVPGGVEWTVTVTRTVAGPLLRLAVWAVGLLTLGALFVALLHERRQGHRLAERSTELERLSAELLRANRAKSEFLANVSHELRTPLNAIVGFVDLLRDGVYGDLPARQSAPVERIASSAQHLRALVDQVLDIAKMAAGRVEVEYEPVDVRPFVLEVITEVESLVAERGLSLSILVGGELPRVYTDRTHLRQVLINLLGNAVKFTTEGGISVRAHVVTLAREMPANAIFASAPPSAEHPWMAIQVVDTGVGIDPMDHERIFGEFEQVNAGPRGDSPERGTGLGLSISRRLTRLLGGELTVESALGRGSVFTVWLPIGRQVTSPAEGTPPPASVFAARW